MNKFFKLMKIGVLTVFVINASNAQIGMPGEEISEVKAKSDVFVRYLKDAKSGQITFDAEEIKKRSGELFELVLNEKKQGSLDENEREFFISKVLLKIAQFPELREFAFNKISKIENLGIIANTKISKSSVIPVKKVFKGVFPDPNLNKKGIEVFKAFASGFGENQKIGVNTVSKLLELIKYLEKNELNPIRRKSLKYLVGFLGFSPKIIIDINPEEKKSFQLILKKLEQPIGFPKRIEYLYSKVDDVKDMSDRSIDNYFKELNKLCVQFSLAKKQGKKPRGQEQLKKMLDYISLIPKFQNRDVKSLKEKIMQGIVISKIKKAEVVVEEKIKKEENKKVVPKKKETQIRQEPARSVNRGSVGSGRSMNRGGRRGLPAGRPQRAR